MKSYSIFAPAKLNLFLHVTGRKSSGYHTLDSLVAFTDIGDMIHIEEAIGFSFYVDGPYAKAFKDHEKESHTESDNLVVRAANALSKIVGKALHVRITLTKNLPLASGLGGGSSDAAATIWGLQELWGLSHHADYMAPLMTKLGADVPVCFLCEPTVMRGIGNVLIPAPHLPEIPIVLVNPGIPCPTQDIFLLRNGDFKKDTDLPESLDSAEDLITHLSALENDLYEAALSLVPAVGNVITALQSYETCMLARMSGSGASCFGLFQTFDSAQNAAKKIKEENPDWWVQAGHLNRPQRY